MSHHFKINKLSKYPDNFSDDQKKALDFLTDFVNDKTKLVATLYGAAGVGKTYILKYFLDNICPYSVCVTAPTHKAVRVIENITGREGKTFHSLHGLRPNTNIEQFDISNPNFDPMGDPKIKNYKLVLVDESSQINTSLDELNRTRARQYNTKILYIGDILQLPPVKQYISKIFTVENKFELTTIMRQEKGNPILEIAGLLRNDIKNGTENALKYIMKQKSKVNDKGQGFITLNIKDFSKYSIKMFNSENFLKDINYVRYLAWTNSSISKWNSYIRNNTIGEIASNEILHKDDLITGYNTILDEFNSPVLINSDDYIIHKLEKRLNDEGIHVFIIELKNVYSGKITPKFIVIDHTNPTFKKFYIQLSNFHYAALYASPSVRKEKWRDYYNFKNKHLVMVDFKLKTGGYVKKDFSYGFGLTVHKSQGSTYSNVFINLLNIAFRKGNKEFPIINTYNNPLAVEFKNRLLYVALTRATDKVFFLY